MQNQQRGLIFFHPILSSSPHQPISSAAGFSSPIHHLFFKLQITQLYKINPEVVENMRLLINKINKLKNSEIEKQVKNRIKEFKKFDKKSNNELFRELCFCILTANFNAKKSIKIQDELGECFLTDSKQQMARRLKELGHRFPNSRADYIGESKKCKDSLNKVVQFHDKTKLRDWIVNSVKGVGYKEASHFLRNIGFDDYAIIDFHIIDVLAEYGLIEKPKTITKKKYVEIENLLKQLAKKTKLSLAELDLYLWYMETGKILK